MEMAGQRQNHDLEKGASTAAPTRKTETFSLRPGLELMIGDHSLTRPEKTYFKTNPDTCDFVFILSGNMKSWIDGFARPAAVSALSTALWLTPRLDASFELLPGPAIRFAAITMDRSLLADMTGDYSARFPRDFSNILEGRQDDLYCCFDSLSIPMQAAVQQLFQCPYNGSMKTLFFEGKVLELTSHLISRQFGGHTRPDVSLSEHDVKSVKKARDYLIESMDKPPSLRALSRHAGVCESKLKRNFRKIFGTSVFDYLRQQRIEKARMLLQAGHMSVTEVSYAVGYSSLSHFTRFFTTHCGVSPQKYLLGFRNPS